MFHLIFDYYGNSWQILILFVPAETGMNTLPSVGYKLSLQPNYVSTLPGKTKRTQNSRTLTAVRSVEPIVPYFRRKSVKIRFPVFVRTIFNSLLAENLLHSWILSKILSSNWIWLILTCKVKNKLSRLVTCHCTLHSYDVIKLLSK